MKNKGMTLLLSLALVAGLFGVLPAPRALAATCTSTGTGNWNAAGTWSGCGSGIPQNGDDVVIASGHTVTVDVNTNNLASLTVNGTLGFDTTARTVTVAGNVTVSSGGTMNTGTSGSSLTHTFNIGGNLTNNGTITFDSGSRQVTTVFNGTGAQTVSGTSSSTNLGRVTVDKTPSTGEVTVSINVSILDTSATNAFNVSSGIWNQTAGTLTVGNTNSEIAGNGEVRITGTASWVHGRDAGVSGASVIVNGKVAFDTTGSISIGRGNNRLEIASGGTGTFTAGTINIFGRLLLAGGSTSTIQGVSFAIDPQDGQSVGATSHVVSMEATANVTMSGGSITVVEPIAASGTGRELLISSGSGTKTFSGGTIFIGDGVSSTAGSADGFEIDTGGVALNNLVVNNQQSGTNRFATLISNPLNLNGSLTIQSGGELRAGTQNIALKSNWTNNGTFNAGTGTVTFNGTAGNQTISGSTATAFNNLTVAGIGGGAGSNSVVVLPTTNIPTASGAVTNNGVLQQEQTVNNNSFHFAQISTNKYQGVEISSTADLGATTVKVYGNQNTSGALGFPVNRWYEIDAGSSGLANLTFHFLCSELQSGQTPATLKVWRFNGSTWDDLGNASNSGSSCSGTYGSVTVNGITLSGASQKYVLKNTSPTAVTLADFYAAQQGDAVLVTWETASELNNRGFNLYRGTSPDGWDRQLNVALIPSQSQGSPSGFVYTWEDRADLAPGTTYYYWLQDVDLSGAMTMHGPVSADFSVPTAVTLSGVQASPAAGAAALPWLWIVAGIGAALGAGRLRRRG